MTTTPDCVAAIDRCTPQGRRLFVHMLAEIALARALADAPSDRAPVPANDDEADVIDDLKA